MREDEVLPLSTVNYSQALDMSAAFGEFSSVDLQD